MDQIVVALMVQEAGIQTDQETGILMALEATGAVRAVQILKDREVMEMAQEAGILMALEATEVHQVTEVIQATEAYQAMEAAQEAGILMVRAATEAHQAMEMAIDTIMAQDRRKKVMLA